ncbi:MAG: ATP-dependent helicase HrpB [Alteromonadaceae bacterium]|nr:ATP-dependent helicase HrpB [Alteromonadaceae bacterium]
MLPIDDLLPELLATLESSTTVLLQAPPGAGKTTGVPLALLRSRWAGNQRILMLEPRRIAARAAAAYMARQLGERPGQTVGYRTRLDTKVSRETRIEVVTEGVLTRLIQQEPALDAYAAVVFDEFHERSLQADLGLALVRESQQVLREDLRILVMSATLDTAPLAELLCAPVLTSEGRAYPVEVRYRPAPVNSGVGHKLEHVVAVIREVLSQEPGSVLVFLPGAGEIRRVEQMLRPGLAPGTCLAPLYGNLKGDDQDRAIRPAAPGERKVVLATAIAETSLTIEGVRVVIDSGLARRALFDPNSGMQRLTTGRVSKAAADQRKGRAGRTEPGVCYRLWSESEQQGLAPFTAPQILEADLAPVALELAQWGARDPGDLMWLDPPPPANWTQAVETLQWLGLLDQKGAITDHGRAARELGIHPRLAHMVIRGREMGYPVTAARLAALLGDRDLLGPRAGANIRYRLQALAGEYQAHGLDRFRLQGLHRDSQKLLPSLAAKDLDQTAPLGRLLAQAYPDRVARRRRGSHHRYLLSNGRGATLREEDGLGQHEWLVAADLDGHARESLIYLAAELDRTDLEADLAHQLTVTDESQWDEACGTVTAARVKRLGAHVLERTPLAGPKPEQVERALIAAVRERGLQSLPWTDMAHQWCARVRHMHALEPERWPDVSDQALLQRLEIWLGPFLAGVSDWRGLQQVSLLTALESQLEYSRQQLLSTEMPSRLTIPTGESVRLDYMAENGPVLAVKLQALFGWQETPHVASGRIPITVHLLSPAKRPLAITSDLASFWRVGYHEVRKEQRGRYPKHPWPEDPIAAEPKRGTKKMGW